MEGHSMNEKLERLGVQSGILNYVDNETPRVYFVSGNADCEEVEKFAKLVAEDIDSEAVKLIEFIANDYYELSHEKIKWQRDDHMKRCQKFFDNYFKSERK